MYCSRSNDQPARSTCKIYTSIHVLLTKYPNIVNSSSSRKCILDISRRNVRRNPPDIVLANLTNAKLLFLFLLRIYSSRHIICETMIPKKNVKYKKYKKIKIFRKCNYFETNKSHLKIEREKRREIDPLCLSLSLSPSPILVSGGL